MSLPFRLAACPAWVFLLPACAPVLESVEEIQLVGDHADATPGALNGLARDAATGELLAMLSSQPVRFTAAGEELPTTGPQFPPVDGMTTRPIGDGAALGDERFVLLTNQDGYLWDTLTGTIEQRFCVVPYMGPAQWQENGAVAVDADGEFVAAVPRFYEATVPQFYEQPSTSTGIVERRLEQTLRTYRLSDGALASTVDLGGIEGDVEGLAFDDDGFLAVVGRELLVIGEGGDVISRNELSGVDAAVGLASDGRRIWVANGLAVDAEVSDATVAGANRVLVYELPPR